MTKIALITGSSKGIGFETAREFGTLGMAVLVGARGREAERLLRQGGADAQFLQLDVTDEESIGRAATQIDAAYGHWTF
jgi:NAD(P)-dependent dehydrogenase (short-subunit alcohol dehydrogenase family)